MYLNYNVDDDYDDAYTKAPVTMRLLIWQTFPKYDQH